MQPDNNPWQPNQPPNSPGGLPPQPNPGQNPYEPNPFGQPGVSPNPDQPPFSAQPQENFTQPAQQPGPSQSSGPQMSWPSFPSGRSNNFQQSQVQQPPQLPSPVNPYNPTPPQPTASDFGASYGTPLPKRRNKLLTALVVLFVLGLLGGGGAFAYLHYFKPSPDKVFKAALNNALSVQQEKLSIGSQDISGGMLYDLSDVRNPRVNLDLKTDLFGLTVEVASYDTKQNSYFTYKHLGDGSTEKQLSGILNKWLQTTKDGKGVSGTDGLNMLNFTGSTNISSLVSDWPLGNFPANDRQELVAYILANQVYKYDAKKVTKGTLKGQSVYVYHVTPNGAKLKELAKKEAKLWGFTDDQTSAALNNLDSSGSAYTLYIGIDSKQLLKTAGTGSTSESATYSYDNVNFPAEPHAELTADQLGQALGGLDLSSLSDSQGGDNTLGSNAAKAKDTEREADINTLQSHIEAFYAQNGYYPTLANLNDASWIATNMKGLDMEALKDPDGSSGQLANKPTAKQYAYQVGTDSNLGDCSSDINSCQYFKLTATLSDGSVYTKEAQ